MVTTCALLAIGVPRLWELTIASSKVLQGPPRCSKVLQGPPRPRKTLSYNRPWRTLDNSYMTYNDLGDYLQYICYLACYLSSVSSLATGSLVLCNAFLSCITKSYGRWQDGNHSDKWPWIKLQQSMQYKYSYQGTAYDWSPQY